MTGSTNSMVGDLVASDWNLDFQAEGVYFGTQQTTAGADFNGGMFKLQTHTTGTGAPDTTLAAWTIYPMYAATSLANKSISIRPTLGIDDNSTPYVFVGTGRLFASADLGTTTQQSIYRIQGQERDAQSSHRLYGRCGVRTRCVERAAVGMHRSIERTIDRRMRFGKRRNEHLRKLTCGRHK